MPTITADQSSTEKNVSETETEEALPLPLAAVAAAAALVTSTSSSGGGQQGKDADQLGQKLTPSVTYVYDEQLARATTVIPHVKNRAFVVHSLIEAYGLTAHMRCVKSQMATYDDLSTFHSQAYLEFLASPSSPSPPLSDEYKSSQSSSGSSSGSSSSPSEQEDEEYYGLGYDCPVFEGMVTFAKIITGGTLTAVDALLGGARLVINWSGGWHHAQRDAAGGFCYVNDIVIGCQKVQQKFKKILYIDLDAHHGDGVENAFAATRKVLTLSLHNFESGYFPGTGQVTDTGFGQGKPYAVNVPLKTGIEDSSYFDTFSRVLELVKAKFCAEAIVVQCGADGLAGDPLGNSNLSEKCVGNCVRKILEMDVPTIFLGGGGYNIPNSARSWAYLTSIICQVDISSDIPEHNFFPLYGPSFELHVTPTLRKNENTADYLSSVVDQIRANLGKMQN